MKRIIAVSVAALCVGSMVFAEETKAAGPKTAIELTQQLDAEYVKGKSAQATGDLFGTDAQYSKTELKGTAAWDLGNDLSASFGLKDSLEFRNNPGQLDAVEGSSAALTPSWLGTLRVRNRFTPSLSFAKKIVPAFNAALGLEYRLATDLRTDKAVTGNTNPEQRIGATPTFTGKVAIVDYSVAQSVNYYLDSNGGDGINEAYLELDGTYGVGTSFKLADALNLKLNLSDRLIYAQASKAEKDANKVALTENYATLKATIVNGDFAPSFGLLYTTLNVKKDYNAANFFGGFVGVDFTKGNYSIGGRYDIGQNSSFETKKDVDGKDQMESHLSVVLKIKA